LVLCLAILVYFLQQKN